MCVRAHVTCTTKRVLARCRFVPWTSLRAPLLVQVGLVEVPTDTGKRIAGKAFELPKLRVVAVVVLLDDLERPPALEHVPADQVGGDPVGDVVVPGFAQQVDG